MQARCLPAIAAISAVAAISAASTASAATAATTAVSAASATAAAALRLRPRFVHHEVTPTEILPVERINRTIRVFIAGNFDERETARLPGKTVTYEINA